MTDPRTAAADALRIAFVGLSDAERAAIAAALGQAAGRTRPYRTTVLVDEADLLIADAEHTPSVKLVLATERLRRTVWVGLPAPRGHVAAVDRPLDAAHLVRELDALVAEWLPAGAVQPARPDSSAARHPHAPAPAPAQGRARPRALLVDDSPVALRFLETRLAPFGLDTDRAASLPQALALLERHRYDFAFVDLELGDDGSLDGLWLCRELRRRRAAGGADTTVVVVSAHASPTDRARGELAGAVAHLAKPLDVPALAALLARHGLTSGRAAG